MCLALLGWVLRTLERRWRSSWLASSRACSVVHLAGLGVQQPRHRHRILPCAPGKWYPTLILISWEPRPERQPNLLLAACLSLRLQFEEQMGSATFSLCQSSPPQLPEGPRAACPELSPISLFIKEVAPFAFSVCCPLRASAISSVVAPAACPWLGEEWPLSSTGTAGSSPVEALGFL